MPTMGKSVKDPNDQTWTEVIGDDGKVQGYIPKGGGGMQSALPQKKTERPVYQGTKAQDLKWNPNTQKVEDMSRGSSAGMTAPNAPPSATSQDALAALIAARKKKQQQQDSQGASSVEQSGPASGPPTQPQGDSGDNYQY